MKIVVRNKYEGNDVKETRTLTFEPYPYDEIEDVIVKIQENLSGDLLKGKRLKYATDVQKSINFMVTVIIHHKFFSF